MAVAREPADKTEIRTLLISEHPSELRSNIYVSGQVVTVLRFEQDCDPAGTKLLDGKAGSNPCWSGARRWCWSRSGISMMANGLPWS
ncbi:MAG TPA: DUF2381 family protein [Archangium sp.]|uniref:DUF2381 family protein n=1 Tax=Archangium sp. TaxID=1872627 RepID=UPI002ED8CA62